MSTRVSSATNLSATYFMRNFYSSSNIDFWLNMMKANFEDSMDTRNVKHYMVMNIKTNNNNKIFDDLYGIGYTTLKNFVYLENDIICQFYSLGIVGIVLFIIPYLFIAISALSKILFNLNRWNVRNFIYIGIVFFAFIVAYLAGHMFDEFFTMFYLAFICGQLVYLEDNNEES